MVKGGYSKLKFHILVQNENILMAIPCLVYPLSNVLTFKHPQKINKNRKSLLHFKLPLHVALYSVLHLCTFSDFFYKRDLFNISHDYFHLQNQNR